MQFVSDLRIGAALVLFIVACAHVPVGASAEEVTQVRIEELVQQLGNDSSRVRERAAEELLKCGMPTKAALFSGMNSKDLEIALRCRRLWCEVRIDVGWQRVREVIGDSPKSRELFDAMFLAAPDLWYELAEQPRPLNAVFAERREQLQQLLKEGRASIDSTEGVLANLFYLGVQTKRMCPEQVAPSLDELLSAGPCQQLLQQALKRETALCELWELWAKAAGTDGPAFDRLLIAMRENRPQAIDLARELLGDSRVPAKQRQYCLLALAKHNNLADAELLARALDDSSVLDVLVTKGVAVKSQLRDVALAAQIHRAGQDPREFGFKYLRHDHGMLFSPATLGFKDDIERRAAFEKWLSRRTGRDDGEMP